ncbi:MAG: hypothetical protein HY429_00570 [Candidatus Levybacteria bacterium]|nr:hypothetical protein [Candidatus Levybacteria bacterium]
MKPNEVEPPRREAPGLTRRSLLRVGAAIAGGAALAGVEASVVNANPLNHPFLRTLEAFADPGTVDVTKIPLSAISVEKDPTVISDMTRQFVADAQSFGGADALGYRISNAWKGADGFWYCGFQGGILQRQGEQTNVWNTLDEMHNLGLDNALDNGSLGVTVPPHVDFDDKAFGDLPRAFAVRVEKFQVPQQILDFVQNLRKIFETGTFTSPGKNYGPYIVWRTQRMAFQFWTDGPNKGLIQRILVGDAAKNAGLIPQEAQLIAPAINEATASPVSPEPNPTEAVLANTQLVDRIQLPVMVRPGTRTLESRITPTSPFAVEIASEGRQELVRTVAAHAETNGFTTVQIIVVDSKDNMPPLSGRVEINVHPDPKVGLTRLAVAEYNYQRHGDTVLFYLLPSSKLDLSDPWLAKRVNEVITREFLEATSLGGTYGPLQTSQTLKEKGVTQSLLDKAPVTLVPIASK